MNSHNAECMSTKWMLNLGLTLALVACTVLAIEGEAEEVPDWEDDEIALNNIEPAPNGENAEEVPDWEGDEVAFRITVLEQDAEETEEVPDWEDDEVAFRLTVIEQDAEETEEIPDWEDDEVAFLGVELVRPGTADLDVFAFVLNLQATVRFETRGETDTYGLLSDDAGLDLASNDDGGAGTNFRIIKTLNPGRYFLGVDGAKGTLGPYVLVATLKKL